MRNAVLVGSVEEPPKQTLQAKAVCGTIKIPAININHGKKSISQLRIELTFYLAGKNDLINNKG